ncbi:hypothetical protein D3C71_2115900 [compost metagenome]
MSLIAWRAAPRSSSTGGPLSCRKMLSGEMSRCRVLPSCSTRRAPSTDHSSLRSHSSVGGVRIWARACFKVMPEYRGMTI